VERGGYTVLRTAIGLTFILTLACAQAAEAPQSDNTIVNLSVVALDNRGQPVNDLTAADFEVIDAGKPRKVAFLNHIDRRCRRVRHWLPTNSPTAEDPISRTPPSSCSIS